MIKIKQSWKLPILFLVGYLFAWGTILIDRQMIIEEQRRLQDEIDSARIELKITKMMNEYNEDSQEMIIWNEEAVEKSKEVGK